MAQTALGVQIRNLEEELGCALLERHSRGVRATRCGEVLARHAEAIIARIEEARTAVRREAEGGTQDVVLGITPSIMRLVGDEILTGLSQTIPEISLHIVEEFSFVLMQLMDRGELHCALTFEPEVEPRFLRRALLEEELYCLTAPGRETGAGPIPFREVMARDLAMTARADAVARIVRRMADQLGLCPNFAYEVQSIRAVKNLAAKGVASAIMPWGAAEGELRKGELVPRHIITPTVTRTLLFVHPPDPPAAMASPAFNGFIEGITDRLLAAEGPITRRL